MASRYYSWSPSDAVAYAKKYALSPNQSYPYFSSTDCTNFVSQSLHNGGIPMYKDPYDEKWGSWFIQDQNYYSNPWVNAWAFYDLLLNNNVIYSSNTSGASLADVYFYDRESKQDGKADHAAIVTGFSEGGDGYPLVSYHTTNRLNVPWYYYWQVEGGDYWHRHINR